MEFRQGILRYEVLLISNDLPTIRKIKSYFDKKQFNVNNVASCSQALEELQKLKPFSILLDRSLPKKNRKEFLIRIKWDKRLNKVSIKTFGKNDPIFKLLEFRQQRIDKKKKEKQIHEKSTKELSKRLSLIDSIRPPTKDQQLEFKINQYITLKLENSRTIIYLNHIRFLNCMRLALNIQKSNAAIYEEIN